MKLKLLLVLFIGAFSTLQSQTNNTGSISGLVIDKLTGQPIAYASIAVSDNGKVVSGAITQENGSFVITKLELKNYKVDIQFIGYKKQTVYATLGEATKTVRLKTVSLETEATELKGVEIVGERSNIVQKIDRKVINVGKDLIASGTTASEIMNNVPTVSIDPQTKEISLRGNTNVRVLIDGKPSNIDAAQLLQQIPSASIKQIELITNPSAKYSPEGMSGIINIILHKNSQRGFNGSINAGVSTSITPKLNSSLNLNYKIGKVNLYANYGINNGLNHNHGFVRSEEPTRNNDQTFKFSNTDTSHLLKTGIDYYINDKNTLSFYTSQNLSFQTGDALTTVDYDDNITNNPTQPNQDTRQFNVSDSDDKTQTYDLDYKHEFAKKDANIEAQVNFSRSVDNERVDYEETFYTPYSFSTRSNIIDGETNYGQFNLDYTNPLTESLKLEVGAESRVQNIKKVFEDDRAIFTATNNFDFERNVHAIYLNISKQLKKWSGQVGVRAEQYTVRADFEKSESNPTYYSKERVNDDIFSLYPSAFLTYAASDKNSYNLTYSRRVDRPSVGQISPIREWTTPLLESRGNPNLKPQFTNSFEFNYTRTAKMGTITAGVFYRQINAEISRVIFNNPFSSTQKILSFDNFENNNAYGIEFSSNLKLKSWWSINASVDSYFKNVKGTVQNVTTGVFEQQEVDATSFNARLNNTFTANKNLRFQLFGMYRGSEMGLQ
ncbi:MAG TPA: TonB-dependent receptor, partial [Flavobacterium sp.]|nr:TonB-dependent receptor [Flavobacterium sp.]